MSKLDYLKKYAGGDKSSSKKKKKSAKTANQGFATAALRLADDEDDLAHPAGPASAEAERQKKLENWVAMLADEEQVRQAEGFIDEEDEFMPAVVPGDEGLLVEMQSQQHQQRLQEESRRARAAAEQAGLGGMWETVILNTDRESLSVQEDLPADAGPASPRDRIDAGGDGDAGDTGRDRGGAYGDSETALSEHEKLKLSAREAALQRYKERQRLRESEKKDQTAASNSTEEEQGTAAVPSIVYRDRSGRPISQEEWEALQKKPERKKKEFKETTWGGGLVQQREKEERMKHEEELMSLPFTRHDIDPRLDKDLREELRWDDPMLEFFAEKEESDSLDVERETQGNEPPPRPKCRFPAPPNRFHIPPGYRWDGVVRGNGFEEALMEEKNVREQKKQMAHQWNVADM